MSSTYLPTRRHSAYKALLYSDLLNACMAKLLVRSRLKHATHGKDGMQNSMDHHIRHEFIHGIVWRLASDIVS